MANIDSCTALAKQPKKQKPPNALQLRNKQSGKHYLAGPEPAKSRDYASLAVQMY